MINYIRSKFEILRRFLPVIWKLHWFDYSSLLELQLAQLKYMEAHWGIDTYCTDSNKVKKDLTTARILTERILEDDYTCAPWRIRTITGFGDIEEFEMSPVEDSERHVRQDLELLYGKLFQKKINNWWD